MIEIPWDGPSVIVPAAAIEVLHKFNHNFNHVPLIQCRNCEEYNDRESLCYRSFDSWNEHTDTRAYAEPKGFCSWCRHKQIACQKADEKQKSEWREVSGIFADERPRASTHEARM